MRAVQRKTQKQTNTVRGSATRAHSEWVRAHPRIDDSAFPEYPDEKSRRGASRGALPNGNPWYPERGDEVPGPRWARPSEPVPGAARRTVRVASQLPNLPRRVEAPPTEPARVAVTGDAPTRADRELAEEVASRLSYSKSFDGKTLEVHVHGEDVFLRGRLPTLQAKVEAGLIASSVRRVTRVHNQIRLGRHG
jgi:hypothetical protein